MEYLLEIIKNILSMQIQIQYANKVSPYKPNILLMQQYVMQLIPFFRQITNFKCCLSFVQGFSKDSTCGGTHGCWGDCDGGCSFLLTWMSSGSSVTFKMKASLASNADQWAGFGISTSASMVIYNTYHVMKYYQAKGVFLSSICLLYFSRTILLQEV